MNRMIIIGLTALALAGCNSSEIKPQLIQKQYVVVVPDNNLYNCPSIGKLPNPDTLTDADVSKLLVRLYGIDAQCSHSIQAIKAYLSKAKATLGK